MWAYVYECVYESVCVMCLSLYERVCVCVCDVFECV